ncbi:hypothetical protein L4174_021270 [Photobacterium sp. CCB-ST2H9]|uniref:hypothetical protein n=1 Tax=Photobacterium sp. CCB-ST2H9 TaxID=2912855 RepID=UPI002004A663|nr:hypothetical protein [Photobacterium sp. CCB-ST2H9]UTM59239.1 hypothetical protein L4174_021270 [Photobacterium sp. CCB-ST2H9]
MFSFNTPPLVPYMRYEEFSRLSGEPLGTIKHKVSNGVYIIKKKEKPYEKPMLNMYAMHEMAAREAKELLG